MTRPLVDMPGTIRPVVRLAWPVLAEQLLAALVGLVDTWLTGNYLHTEAHLAAIGLMAYLMWLFPSMFAAVSIGATALVSRFVGAGDIAMGAKTTNQAMLMGAVLAAVSMLLTVCLAPWFVEAMALRGEAATLALRYLAILVPVLPAIMTIHIGIACFRGAGDTISGFGVMTTVNIVNAAVSTCLVIGPGPIPRLGWDGLALGTAAAHIVGAALVIGLLIRGRAGMRLRRRWLKPDWELMRRLLRVGIPGGADQAAILTCHLLFLRVVNSLGTEAAAAHSLGVRIEALAYLPGSAFQIAAQTLAGQFLGAGDQHRASRSVGTACMLATIVMTSAAIVFYLGSQWLADFFTGGGPTADLASPLLRIVGLALPSLAVTMVLNGALRGAGDTRWPFLFTIIGLLLVRLPLAVWLSAGQEHVALGIQGAWWAMVVDNWLRSILVAGRFFHGGWRTTKV